MQDYYPGAKYSSNNDHAEVQDYKWLGELNRI